MIKKVKSGYRVISHTTGRNMGTYKTKAQAQRRLRQVEYFKRLVRPPKGSILKKKTYNWRLRW